MNKRRFGLVLVLMFAIAIAAATLYEDLRLDEEMARERGDTDQFVRTAHSAQMALANLRGAEAAYVAVGQGQGFWLARGSDLAAELERALSTLQADATSPAASLRYGAAMSALGSLNSLDQQARDSLAQGQHRLAADVIFSEATASGEVLAAEMSAAASHELTAREARLRLLRQRRFQTEAAATGALLVTMLIAVVLGWRPREPAEPVEQAEPLVPARVTEPATGPPPAPVRRPELAEAAQVCVDLARLLDGDDLPPLLGRAAHVLDAKGVVLWVADGSGATLRPSLAHGYSDKVLQRLPPLQIDADNMTSLAFRSMQAQRLRSSGAGQALAVPLITSAGCVGVLAAEIGPGRAEEDTLAVARMFAAQLATVIAPVDQVPSASHAAEG